MKKLYYIKNLLKVIIRYRFIRKFRFNIIKKHFIICHKNDIVLQII